MEKEKIKKILTKADKLQKGKEVALSEEFISIEEKLDTLTEELKKKLESELVLEINRDELKGEKGDKGDRGDTGEKGEKGEKGDTKIVEKVIEKIEVIRETPIVTENVVEVAKYETPDEITNKINQGKPLIKKERIEGFADLDRIVKENAHKLYTGISETRARELISQLSTTSSGGGTWGSITGTLSDQTDLQTALDAKADLAGDTFTGDISVPDEAYGAGWNGSMEVPTKNALYDKIETLGGAGANTALSNLASVAINTSLISDTDSTDDLGSSSIKWRNVYNQNLYSDVIGYTSIRPLFGERGIVINELADVLWRANRRFTFTSSYGGSSPQNMFDGDFETTYVIPVSTTDVININVANQSGVPANGITYPEGKLYVHFYYINHQYSSISARTKMNGVWYNLPAPTDISTDATNKVLEFTVSSNNYLTDIELTVTTDGSNPVWITGINYMTTRWTSETEPPYVDKYQANNRLNGNLNFINNSGTSTAYISNTAGDSYFTGKLGIGTSTPGTYHANVAGNILGNDIVTNSGSVFRSLGDAYLRANSTSGIHIGDSASQAIDLGVGGGAVGINTASVVSGTKLQVNAGSATASSTILKLYGSATGFSGGNDAGTAYALTLDACSYQTSIKQSVGAKIELIKENTWNYADTPTGIKGSLAFYTSSGTPDSPTLTLQQRIYSDGTVRFTSLDTDATAPTTSGTTKMVITDANGQLSFDDIPAGGGDVSKVGTPVNNQVGVWTGDGTLEGDTAFTFDTATDALSITTAGIFTTGTIELGAASDTTISRSSAGVIAVEGSNVIMASNKLSALSATTSAELAGVISDETGSGLLVFNDTPTLTTPVVAGTPNADAEVGYDTTLKAPTYYANGAVGTIAKVVATGVGTQSLTNSTIADQDYTSVYTIPANALYTNKVYRVTLTFEMVSGTSTATTIFYLKLGATKVYTQTAQNFLNGTTVSFVLQYIISGRAAASASSAVSTAALIGMGANFNGGNITNQPVNLATNGTLAITPGLTFSATGSTDSFELQAWMVEEI